MTSDKSCNGVSLRLMLTLPYMVLVIALAVTLGVLSYQAGSSAINTLTHQLLLETVGRITQAVDRHIVGSGAVLETAFPEGMAAPGKIESDLENLRTRFWIATALHTDPNDYVYYGNESGQGLGILRLDPNRVEMRMKLGEQERRAIYQYEGIDGALQFVRREDRVFDPRTRPWYLDGKGNDGHTWTTVYIDFGTRELVATRARQVLSVTGEFEGVVATDVSLKALNDFVSRLQVSPNGIAFIIEPTGSLIASSATPNVILMPDGEYRRASAEDSDHPILREAYRAIIDYLDEHGIPDDTHSLSVGMVGSHVHVAFDRIRDNAGLDWITVVAMPDSDFMSGITDNIRKTAAIAVLAIAITLLIGLLVLNRVAADLKRLKIAACRVGAGELDAPVGIHRRDELGDLARSFEAMQRRLQTDDLTGALNREAFMHKLQRRIDDYKADRRRHRMAVLFVDLDRFKHINDTHGHDVGDLALVEVTRRLLESVRQNDLVGRYAGDEFVVLLSDIDGAEKADTICESIQRLFEEPLSLADSSEVMLGASIGIAIYPDDGDSAEVLLKVADGEMYQEKGERSRGPNNE